MEEQQIAPTKIIPWLNILIALTQWDQKLPTYLVRLFDKRDQYEMALENVRQGITHPDPAQPLPPGPTVLTAEEWRKLYLGMTRATAVRELFASDQDPFAGANGRQLSLLADLSDITTDPQTMVYASNGAFVGVLETVRQSPVLNTDQKIREGLEKFLALYETNQAMAEMLNELALSGDWQVVLASLRDRSDYTDGGETTAAVALQQWNEKLDSELRGLLFMPGHLARVPMNLVQTAWKGRDLFVKAAESISLDPAKSPVEKRKQTTDAALPLFRSVYATELAAVEAELGLLAIVAVNYLKVRKFAKLDAFVYTWPQVAMLAMSNYPNLEYVEDTLVIRRQRPTEVELDAREARELFELCAKDAGLTRFLRLRPYFSEIDENELRRYKVLAPVVIQETSPIETSAVGAATSAHVPPPRAVSYAPTYTCYLKIEASGRPTSEGAYEVTMTLPDNSVQKNQANFTVASLLVQLLSFVGVGPEDMLQPVLKDLFSNPTGPGEAKLARCGTHLLKTLLGSGPLRKEFDKLLNAETSIRIVVQTADDKLAYLPWEWLPKPSLQELLVRDPRYSIVRSGFMGEKATPPPLSLPLRLMATFPSPPGVANPREFASSQALGQNLPQEEVELTTIVGSGVTLSSFESTLKSHAPQVVHFEGEVNLSPAESGVSAISIHFADGAMSAADFGKLLVANQVQLLVIGHNRFGHLSNNPIAAMAARLVSDGLPAVVAPVRGIDDVSATVFTTELYRSFLQGNTLEAAVCIARRKLASKGGDWSAFALFGDPEALNYFLLFPASS